MKSFGIFYYENVGKMFIPFISLTERVLGCKSSTSISNLGLLELRFITLELVTHMIVDLC